MRGRDKEMLGFWKICGGGGAGGLKGGVRAQAEIQERLLRGAESMAHQDPEGIQSAKVAGPSWSS